MAETVVHPNNAGVKFTSKPMRERTMPVKSQAQNAAMHAAAEGKSAIGIPKKVGKEFTAEQEPGSVKKLPKRIGQKASKLHKSGLISDKQLDRLHARKG